MAEASYSKLDPRPVRSTIEVLRHRIDERFPASGLFGQAIKFSGHVPATIAICADAVLAGRGEPRSGPMALAGAIAGAAILIDFTMAIAAAALLVVVAVRTRSLRTIALFAACCGAMAAVQLAVNAACFGGPFDFAYHLATGSIRRILQWLDGHGSRA